MGARAGAGRIMTSLQLMAPQDYPPLNLACQYAGFLARGEQSAVSAPWVSRLTRSGPCCGTRKYTLCDRAMPNMRLIGRRHNDEEQDGVVRNSFLSPTILAEHETTLSLSGPSDFPSQSCKKIRKTCQMSRPRPPPAHGGRQGRKFEDTTTLALVVCSV